MIEPHLIKTKEKEIFSERLLSIWIIAIIAIVPIISRLIFFDYYAPYYDGSVFDSGRKFDAFMYIKFISLSVLSTLLLFTFLGLLLKKKIDIRRQFSNWPLILLTVLVLLSIAFAPYKSISLYGSLSRFEGTVTFLCYLLLFFVSANLIYKEKMVQSLFSALYFVAGINAILAIASFFGYSLYQNAFIQAILFSTDTPSYAKEIKDGLHTTLGNRNFWSGLSSVLTIMFIARGGLEIRWKERILPLLAGTFTFVSLLASLSTSGFVTFVIMLPMLILLMVTVNNKKQSISILLGVLLVFSLLLTGMVKYNPRVWTESVGFFIGQTTEKSQEKKGEEYTSPYLPQLPERGIAAGNGRLYIWKETLSLVKERPLIGHGMDSLTYFFDQNDINKYSGIKFHTSVIDMPHNFLLNIAFGAGIPALLVFLYIVVCWLRKCILIVRKNSVPPAFYVMTLGVISYLIQGLFNDSVIGTSVIFWILFGYSTGWITQIEKENRV